MSDLISRQAVLDGIDKYVEKAQSTGTIDDFNSFAELVIKTLPSVENKGEWICYTEEFYQQGRFASIHHRIIECSLCHHKIADFVGNMNFCPNCGAYMRGNNRSAKEDMRDDT